MPLHMLFPLPGMSFPQETCVTSSGLCSDVPFSVHYYKAASSPNTPFSSLLLFIRLYFSPQHLAPSGMPKICFSLGACVCLPESSRREGLSSVQGCVFHALSCVWSTLVPGVQTLLFLGYSQDSQEQQERSSLILRLSWKMQALGLVHSDHLQKSCPSDSVLQHPLLLLGP